LHNHHILAHLCTFWYICALFGTFVHFLAHHFSAH